MPVTLAQRCRELDLALRVEPADRNPLMEDEWRDANHWRCTVICGKRRMVTPFSQGSAHTEPPTLEDVVNALVLDAAGFENARTFEDWCGEYGYDTDSRKAERTYNAIKRQTAKFKALIDPLGAAAWQNLLYHTETL